MTWVDRLRQAAYTSPSGARFVWAYENVSRSFDKHTSGFDPAGGRGTFVQDLGHSGFRYTLRMFFSGPDYDLEATAFEAALQETGAGILEHPAYGRVPVVPFGTVTRRDDLKTQANQAVIELAFWETTATAYPSSQGDPAAAVADALEVFNATGAAGFADAVDLQTAASRATFVARFRAVFSAARSGLQAVADATDAVTGTVTGVEDAVTGSAADVRARYDAIADSIDQGLNLLVEQPRSLASQVYQLVQAPAASAALIADKLATYRNLISSLINGDGAVAPPGGGNDFRTSDLFAVGAVTGSIEAALQTEFQTKSGALTAAEEILSQFQDVAAWREANFASLEDVDAGASYQALQEAAALTAGFLVDISFTLAQERRIVLDRKRTIIDLAAELYGQVDDRLDFLINSNQLTGSEILELPEGRQIVYYR